MRFGFLNQSPSSRLILPVVALILLVTVSTLGFSLIEGWSLDESLYMTVITVSTVGYTEVHPLSGAGRFFASLVIVAALGVALYGSTRLGQLILEGELLAVLEQRRMNREIANLSGHFILCGYGRVGRSVARELKNDGREVCVVDASGEATEDLRSEGLLFVIGDATDEEVLSRAGVERARAVLCLLPSDAENLFVTMSVKGMNSAAEVITRCSDQKAESKLVRGGADRVVSVYHIASAKVVQAALKPATLDFLDLATHRENLALGIEELPLAPDSVLVGESLAGAGIGSRYGVIVVAIKKADGEMVFNPGAGDVFRTGDVLVAIGPTEKLKHFEHACTLDP